MQVRHHAEPARRSALIFVTLNLFQGPWPDLSLGAAFFVSRKGAKAQRHEEEGLGRRIRFHVNGAAGRAVKMKTRFAAGATSLRLCAKNNWRRLAGQPGPWMLKQALASCIAARFA
ncbi:hypothetical protein [Sphingopyxis sp. QXT-31]|uniref:hypothetical protein n=1 Tax=Sphingopyxis sp. QXT-31 TaxID=1357916 RepID=UPI0018DE614B|nr:hypothetical protein [Sphingopyxis sp. QXT-31]